MPNQQQILKDELDNDPLVRGYAAMTDLEAADDLNLVRRDVDKKDVDSRSLLEVVLPADFPVAQKDRDYFRLILSQQVSLDNANIRAALDTIFSTAPITKAAIEALYQETISRADELGLTRVREGTVNAARNLP